MKRARWNHWIVVVVLASSFFVDYGSPAQASVGTIQIAADSFVTDSDMADFLFAGRNITDAGRDIYVRRTILLSENNPYYITFTPTALEGLPEQIAVGDSITFQVVGDLTMRGETRSEVFKVTLNVVSEDRLEGNATTTIDRTTYGIFFPLPPFVAGVSEEVILEFDFVAEAQ